MLAYYRDEGEPEIGRRLATNVMSAIENLADYPDMGRVVPPFDQSNLRELIRPPFRIVYRHDPGRVRIVRIWRTERLLKLPDE